MTTRPRALLVAALVCALVTVLVTGVACDKGSADAGKSAGQDQPAEAASAASESAATPPAPVDISSAKAPADTWMLLGVADYGFEARFPVAPKKEDMSLPTPAGTIPASIWMAEHGEEIVVGVTVMTVPDAMLGDFNVEGALDGGRDGMVNNVGGTIVSEKQADFAGQTNARAVVATVPNPAGSDLVLEARLFWVSPRAYQLIAVYPSGSDGAMARKFFNSFKVISD